MKIKKNLLKLLTLSLLLSVSMYAAEEPKDATNFTKEKNEQVLKESIKLLKRELKELDVF